MDIVGFAEKFTGIQLTDWQKRHLRFLYDLSRKGDVRIVMGKNGQVFTYFKPKELILNGSTNDCK